MDKAITKIVFMGTPDFSAKILEGLINDDYNIIGVITEIDKPVGKKQEIIPTPVKVFAISKELSVFQPEKKADIIEVIKSLSPDLIIVAAYGKIIPKEALDIPKYGFINFHTSFLPHLRGPAPIQFAILGGLEETGVTIMKMDEGVDTGPILSQIEIPIQQEDTSSSLSKKMLDKGINLLLNTIPKYIDGNIIPNEQLGEITYTRMINKEDGIIDFSNTAEEEFRKYRAFDIWPGVFTYWGEKRLKIIEADYGNQLTPYKSGEVFLNDGDLCIAFREGYWMIKKLQIEGSKIVNSRDFINGYKQFVGSILD